MTNWYLGIRRGENWTQGSTNEAWDSDGKIWKVQSCWSSDWGLIKGKFKANSDQRRFWDQSWKVISQPLTAFWLKYHFSIRLLHFL